MRVTQILGCNLNFQKLGLAASENGDEPVEMWRLTIRDNATGDLEVVDFPDGIRQALVQQLTGLVIAQPGEVPKEKPKARSRAKKGS